MERNILGGELWDKLNAILSAVGFNLVKLTKGLKKRWLKRLFLYLQAAMERFAARTAWFIQLAAVEIVRPATILRSPSGCSNWGFA